MFNRKNLIYWILILVALIAVVLVLTLKGKKGESNIKGVVNEVNTSTIDKIVYKTPDNSYDIMVERQPDQTWIIKANGKQYKADTVRINMMYIQSANVKPMRVAAVEKDKWKLFDVTPDKATDVKFYSGKDLVKEFYVGKFENIQNDPKAMSPDQKTTNPSQTSMTSYIREKNDNVVYAVNGYVGFSYPSNYNTLRSQTIYSVNPIDFTELSVETAEGNHLMFTRDANNKWLFNGAPTDTVDSKLFIGKLRSMICNDFVDNVPAGIQPDATLTIKGKTFDPVIIKFYKYDAEGFVITTSFNPDGIFLDKKGILRKRIESFHPNK